MIIYFSKSLQASFPRKDGTFLAGTFFVFVLLLSAPTVESEAREVGLNTVLNLFSDGFEPALSSSIYLMTWSNLCSKKFPDVCKNEKYPDATQDILGFYHNIPWFKPLVEEAVRKGIGINVSSFEDYKLVGGKAKKQQELDVLRYEINFISTYYSIAEVCNRQDIVRTIEGVEKKNLDQYWALSNANITTIEKLIKEKKEAKKAYLQGMRSSYCESALHVGGTMFVPLNQKIKYSEENHQTVSVNSVVYIMRVSSILQDILRSIGSGSQPE